MNVQASCSLSITLLMCAHCLPKQAGRLVTCSVKHSCEFIVSRPYSFSQNPILDELLVFIYLYQEEMALFESVGSTKDSRVGELIQQVWGWKRQDDSIVQEGFLLVSGPL